MSNKAAALARLAEMEEAIRNHIEAGECNLREVETTFDAFKSLLWAEETDRAVCQAVELFRQEARNFNPIEEGDRQ